LKAEKNGGYKSSLFKRSIGARILLTVALILLGVMIFLQVFVRISVASYIETYYTDIGELIAELAAEELSFFPDDIREFQDSEAAKDLLRLCEDYQLYSIWVESSEPPYETGTNEILLSNEGEFERDEEGKIYTLGPEERAIFSGEKDEAIYQYKSSHGYDIIAYLHGIYDDYNNCIAVIGINFEKELIYDDIQGSADWMAWIIALIFTGLMITLVLFLHFSIFGPLRVISKRMRNYASEGQLSTDKLVVKGEDDLSRMAASYNKMTDEISTYVRKIGVLEKERLMSEAEMNVAAEIQTGMLPPASFDVSQIHIDAVMKPAKEVAGDFYDYMPLPDGRMFLCIADVSGKGVSAALFMAQAVNAIRYNAVLYSSPAKTMYAANNDLCARNPEMLFVTAFAAVYDPADGSLTYCNAGHNPAYLTGSGIVDMLEGADCLFLGLFPNEEYVEASIEIRPGKMLFLYTDGLTEAIDPDKAMFGRERMEAELVRYAGEVTDEALPSRMMASVQAFTRGAEVFDDLTMMAIRFGRSVVLPASTDENGTLRHFLMEEEQLPRSEMKKICLAAEEIFVNICHYAYDNKEPGTVRVSTLLTDESYILMFADTGMPYDPLEQVRTAEEYDPDEEIGGLGKIMTFTIMDRQKYEYRNGFNILTLARSLKNCRGKEV